MILNVSQVASSDQQQGTLLLFDGTSCAGKTSICKNMKDSNTTPFHYIALDDFITDIFEEQKLRPRPLQEFITICNKQTELMYLHIDAMISHGHNILCDTTLTCLENAASTNRWFKIINNINNKLILVYCPFDILVKRLQHRNHHARIEHQLHNSRIASIVVRQFTAMFKARSYKHGLIIDELSRNQIENAFELVRDDFANADQFASIRTEIMHKLGLFDHKKIFISPRIFYDYIINTHLYPVEQCIQLIMQNIDSIDKNYGHLVTKCP
jgi:chloramphenicol 3-O-phosphotransferase